MYYANKKKYKSIWMGGSSSKPYLARHLTDPVRAVLAFWDYDAVPIEVKAEAAGLLPGEFLGINRMLLRSDEPAVLFCKLHGIPGSASVKLSKPFRCNGCRALLTTLPCIFCWNGPDDDPHVQ